MFNIASYRESFRELLVQIINDNTVIIDHDFAADTVTKGIAFNITEINQEHLISGAFGVESIEFECFAVGKTRAICDELSEKIVNDIQLLHNEGVFQRFYVTDFTDVEFNPYEDNLYSNKIKVKAFISRENRYGG
ncbi:MAG: hypothetical protein K5752_04330 [Succinivibrionaceae bacterium]|nr:hypothetical protein [Succinivibrionaceae bacterium]